RWDCGRGRGEGCEGRPREPPGGKVGAPATISVIPLDLAEIALLIPEAAALKDEWKRDYPKAKDKLKALVRLEIVRAIQNRDAAARMRYLASLVKDHFDDPKAMADTGMIKDQITSLKQELAQGHLSPANKLPPKPLP